MGGIGGGGVLDTVEVYDPQADSWQRVASMPRGLRSHAAAAMGGKIYVTGGVTGLGAPPVNSVYVYTTRRLTLGRSWLAWAPLGGFMPPQWWVASSTSSAVSPALSISARRRSTTLLRTAAGRR